MSLPGKKNIDIYRGDYHEWPMVINVNAGTLENPNPVPINFTGYTFAAQVRAEPDSPILVSFDFNTDDIASGRVVPYLTQDKTEGLAAGTYVWDFQTTDPQGRVQTWVAGSVKVTPDVTRIED